MVQRERRSWTRSTWGRAKVFFFHKRSNISTLFRCVVSVKLGIFRKKNENPKKFHCAWFMWVLCIQQSRRRRRASCWVEIRVEWTSQKTICGVKLSSFSFSSSSSTFQSFFYFQLQARERPTSNVAFLFTRFWSFGAQSSVESSLWFFKNIKETRRKIKKYGKHATHRPEIFFPLLFSFSYVGCFRFELMAAILC